MQVGEISLFAKPNVQVGGDVFIWQALSMYKLGDLCVFGKL